MASWQPEAQAKDGTIIDISISVRYMISWGVIFFHFKGGYHRKEENISTDQRI